MAWTPSFFREHHLFWPIERAAAKLERFGDWPAPADLALLFDGVEGGAPVRFEHAPPRPRRGPAPAGARYDARISLERVVPTRAQSWHDLLNALVWASFPRAKTALHARQHRMILSRLGDDSRLPGARSKEQDAVAMLDEGGVVVLRERGRAREECAIVFGHAIYEGLVCRTGPAAVRGAAYAVEIDAIPGTPAERVRIADTALAELLSREAPIAREDFGSVVVSGSA